MSLYLVLEGGDGVGKTHQAGMLREWLTSRGQRVRHVREPGSTTTGEAVRQLLLSPGTGGLSPWTEALLFSAARVELLSRQIRPALESGEVVVSERCWLSTMAYQCLAPLDRAQRVPLAEFSRLTKEVHGDTWPDRVFLLDVDAETRTARAEAKQDRIEAFGEVFHQSVRRAYLELAAQDQRITVVDATGSPDEVQEQLQSEIAPLLPEGVS